MPPADQPVASPEPFNFQTFSSPGAHAAAGAGGSPDAAQLDPADFNLHGFSPLEHPLPVVRCSDCERPVLQSAILNHVATCQKVRALEHAAAHGEDDGRSLSVGMNPHKRRSSNASLSSAYSPPPKRSKLDPPSPSSARSLAADSEYGGSTSAALENLSKEDWATRREIEKRLLKEAQRAEKKGERSGPLDLNRHCGVINLKGVPCSRALTCKSHSVGAKRDVPGRSKPYDVLFAEWNAVHKPHLLVKQNATRLRRESEKASGSGGLDDGAGGEGSKGGAGGPGKKKGAKKKSTSSSAGTPSSTQDISQSSAPVSELAWLIASAQASRARLAGAPSRRLATALQRPPVSAPPTTIAPAALLAPPGPNGAVRKTAQQRQTGLCLFPREAGKTLLYGRRRQESATLNSLLREALTGDARKPA